MKAANLARMKDVTRRWRQESKEQKGSLKMGSMTIEALDPTLAFLGAPPMSGFQRSVGLTEEAAKADRRAGEQAAWH